MTLDDTDCGLLRRIIPNDAVNWRGGIRDTASGGVTFIEAIDCRILDDVAAQRVGMMLASAYRGFYEAAADGAAVSAIDGVREWYGETIEDNYPEAGTAFLRFATTYWTLKVLVRQLEFYQLSPLARWLLVRLDSFLGDLFFPIDGPFKIAPTQRERDQVRLLNAFGPRIAVSDFIDGNPILIRDKALFSEPGMQSDRALHVQRAERKGFVQLAIITVGLAALFAFFRPTRASLLFSLMIASTGALAGYFDTISGRLDYGAPKPLQPRSLVRQLPFILLGAACLNAALDREWVGVAAFLLFFFAGAALGILLARTHQRASRARAR